MNIKYEVACKSCKKVFIKEFTEDYLPSKVKCELCGAPDAERMIEPILEPKEQKDLNKRRKEKEEKNEKQRKT